SRSRLPNGSRASSRVASTSLRHRSANARRRRDANATRRRPWVTPDREASARLPEQETPAVPGRIHGLRGLSLDEGGPFRRLGSRTRAMIWPPNDNMVAACLGSEDSAAHPAPAPGCHCGIHAHHPFGAGVEVLAESLATPESGFANGIGWTV